MLYSEHCPTNKYQTIPLQCRRLGRFNRFIIFRHGTDSKLHKYVNPPFILKLSQNELINWKIGAERENTDLTSSVAVFGYGNGKPIQSAKPLSLAVPDSDTERQSRLEWSQVAAQSCGGFLLSTRFHCFLRQGGQKQENWLTWTIRQLQTKLLIWTARTGNLRG